LHHFQDVGQPKWRKFGQGFKARFAIKLDGNAIGYFVKKWNDLEISIAGKTVTAELAGRQTARGPRNNVNKKAKMDYDEELLMNY